MNFEFVPRQQCEAVSLFQFSVPLLLTPPAVTEVLYPNLASDNSSYVRFSMA